MTIRSALVAFAAALFLATPVSAEDPWVEFDKKPQHNPTSPAPLTIVATGTFNLPEGYQVISVRLRYYKAGGETPLVRTVVKATIDENAKTWTAKAEHVEEAGEYWVDAEIDAKRPDGQTSSINTLDQRRVYVKDLKK